MGLATAAEEEVSRQPRSPVTNKRKSDAVEEGDPFKRVVKKLIVSSAHAQRPRMSEASPSASSSSVPQFSPALQLSALTQPSSGMQLNCITESPSRTTNGMKHPTSSQNVPNVAPLHPPPFQPDLDLFLEGTKSYAQLNSNVQTPAGAMADPTSMDLSYRR